MIVTIDGLPVYNAELDGDDTGMYCISLVEYPAVLRDFQALSAQERQERERTRQMYAITDEERQLVRGVVMRADFPIYRCDTLEYYIIYKADTIRQMAEKYLADKLQNQVNLDHTPGAYVEGVQMVQWFIKDSAAGIAPEGFDDCADGSLFAEFHITDPEIWAAIKDGTYKGFSLEGYFALTPEDDQQEVERIVEETKGLFSQILNNAKNMSLAKFKALFAKLVKMRTATSDKGVIAWDGDNDLAVGDELFLEDEEGNRSAAPDGVYTLTDGTAVTVAEGRVTEIVAPEASDPAAETFGEVDTDKGRIRWDGDEDLRAGDAVYRIDEDGNRAEVEDGEYTTPDGKVITVADGKVASITDPAAEVEAKRQERLAIRQRYEASYDEKYRAIASALAAVVTGDFYIIEAGDDFAVVDTWDENYIDHYYRYAIRVSEDAAVTIEGDPVEVKQIWVPLDFVSPFERDEAEELRQENARLSAELEKLRRQPAAPSAHKAAKMAAETKTSKRERLARLVR